MRPHISSQGGNASSRPTIPPREGTSGEISPQLTAFFTSADKFKSRYATFGFNDTANLDEGAMWPTSFALKELTAVEEAKIAALVKKAVS